MQETLALILCGLIFAGVIVAGLYMLALTGFFRELREREPDVWRGIGGPSLSNMLLLPVVNFRKFYAFYHVLKARRGGAYRYAGRAWLLLWTGLLFCLALFVLVAFYAALL
jgi:hypothetical protein